MFKVKDRELVVPGQFIGDGVHYGENCFIEGGGVYSMVQGMVRVRGDAVRVIPSFGAYIPKKNDVVIGVIVDVLQGGWLVEINSPDLCYMVGEEATRDVLGEDLSRYYAIGDRVSVKIWFVNEVNSCNVERPWKLRDGVIIEVNPKRIPRVVGKKRSMLEILKKKTGCNIVVGQNGRVWVKGDDPDSVELAINAIRKIEREAQSSGLTDRIEKMLEEARGN